MNRQVATLEDVAKVEMRIWIFLLFSSIIVIALGLFPNYLQWKHMKRLENMYEADYKRAAAELEVHWLRMDSISKDLVVVENKVAKYHNESPIPVGNNGGK